MELINIINETIIAYLGHSDRVDHALSARRPDDQAQEVGAAT